MVLIMLKIIENALNVEAKIVLLAIQKTNNSAVLVFKDTSLLQEILAYL